MAKMLLLLFGLFAFCGDAIAQESRSYMSGNELFGQFVHADPMVRRAAMEYVVAVIDSKHYLEGAGILPAGVICVPMGVTIGQAGDVVKKYLEDHPERRHYAAASTVFAALTIAFPCSQNQTK